MAIAMALQVLAWAVVASLDVSLQRPLLESMLVFYTPAFALAEYLMPSEWFVGGNVLLGFLILALAVVAYSVVATAASMVVWRFWSEMRSRSGPVA